MMAVQCSYHELQAYYCLYNFFLHFFCFFSRARELQEPSGASQRGGGPQPQEQGRLDRPPAGQEADQQGGSRASDSVIHQVRTESLAITGFLRFE